MSYYNYRIPENLDGDRLDKALASLTQFSRTFIQKIIYQEGVIVNSKLCKDQTIIVRYNDEIKLIIPEPRFLTVATSNNIKLDIVYEDNELIIINKPPGMTVHPGAGHHSNDTLVHALLSYVGAGNLSNVSGVIRPGIVHRLDRDTSGLMVIAKNNITHLNLSKQIASRELKRMYLAVVWGVPRSLEGTIKNYIRRSRSDYTKMRVSNYDGKIAITHYKVLTIVMNGLMSIVQCQLETGRTHQIRLHMSHIGCSIVGDQKYGHNLRKVNSLNVTQPNISCLKEYLLNFKRQALHSYYIAFTHTSNNNKLHYTILPPIDIRSLLSCLNINLASYSNYIYK